MILDHTHGVNATRCDHPDCKAAVAAYAKRWRYDRAHTGRRTTDAEPTRLHIATLTGAGWSYRAIAGAAGIAVQTVSRVASGRQATLRRTAAAAILGLDPSWQIPRRPSRQVTEPFVPKIGAVRRIQALLALGWPHSAQQAHSGVYTASVLSQQGRWITRTTHAQIARMYRELSGRRGPSPRTRGWARRLGYHGPAAWDDIDHDPEPEHLEPICTMPDCAGEITARAPGSGLCQRHYHDTDHRAARRRARAAP